MKKRNFILALASIICVITIYSVYIFLNNRWLPVYKITNNGRLITNGSIKYEFTKIIGNDDVIGKKIGTAFSNGEKSYIYSEKDKDSNDYIIEVGNSVGVLTEYKNIK